MKVQDFSYALPKELIAQEPLSDRSKSRMMVVDRSSGKWEHRYFNELPNILEPSDLLVINNTKVIPARLIGNLAGSQTRIELLLLKQVEKHTWEVLIKPSKRVFAGSLICFHQDIMSAQVLEKYHQGRTIVKFSHAQDFYSILHKIGRPPLPPYIKRVDSALMQSDLERYQTVYAEVRGSVAAPTAGLHFTEDVLLQLKAKGIGIGQITLHVGYGTFQPVRVDDIEEHRMEFESFEISEEAEKKINEQRKNKGRIIAVGTTTTRTLEHVASLHNGTVRAEKGWTNLFIFPGYEFKIVSGLLTNFHLPGSTLLMLVCAFAENDLILCCYHEAMKEKYRFYSYGDCMLLL